jgi:hypothetical protein
VLVCLVAFAAAIITVGLSGGGGPGPWAPEEGSEPPLKLTLPAAPPSKDGIALAILVDTSGSMNDGVRDAGGGMRPKLEIARRSVAGVLGQVEAFTAAHPEKAVQVGVYEFSQRQGQPNCRPVVALGPLKREAAEAALGRLRSSGGTPIGDAMAAAKSDLDRAGYKKMHLLVVTDGENTAGHSPGQVARLLGEQPEEHRASLYFVAFDIAAEKFNAVKEAGALLVGAANETELKGTFDYILTGKILVEQTNP